MADENGLSKKQMAGGALFGGMLIGLPGFAAWFFSAIVTGAVSGPALAIFAGMYGLNKAYKKHKSHDHDGHNHSHEEKQHKIDDIELKPELKPVHEFLIQSIEKQPGVKLGDDSTRSLKKLVRDNIKDKAGLKKLLGLKDGDDIKLEDPRQKNLLLMKVAEWKGLTDKKRFSENSSVYEWATQLKSKKSAAKAQARGEQINTPKTIPGFDYPLDGKNYEAAMNALGVDENISENLSDAQKIKVQQVLVANAAYSKTPTVSAQKQAARDVIISAAVNYKEPWAIEALIDQGSHSWTKNALLNLDPNNVPRELEDSEGIQIKSKLIQARKGIKGTAKEITSQVVKVEDKEKQEQQRKLDTTRDNLAKQSGLDLKIVSGLIADPEKGDLENRFALYDYVRENRTTSEGSTQTDVQKAYNNNKDFYNKIAAQITRGARFYETFTENEQSKIANSDSFKDNFEEVDGVGEKPKQILFAYLGQKDHEYAQEAAKAALGGEAEAHVNGFNKAYKLQETLGVASLSRDQYEQFEKNFEAKLKEKEINIETGVDSKYNALKSDPAHLLKEEVFTQYKLAMAETVRDSQIEGLDKNKAHEIVRDDLQRILASTTQLNDGEKFWQNLKTASGYHELDENKEALKLIARELNPAREDINVVTVKQIQKEIGENPGKKDGVAKALQLQISKDIRYNKIDLNSINSDFLGLNHINDDHLKFINEFVKDKEVKAKAREAILEKGNNSEIEETTTKKGKTTSNVKTIAQKIDKDSKDAGVENYGELKTKQFIASVFDNYGVGYLDKTQKKTFIDKFSTEHFTLDSEKSIDKFKEHVMESVIEVADINYNTNDDNKIHGKKAALKSWVEDQANKQPVGNKRAISPKHVQQASQIASELTQKKQGIDEHISLLTTQKALEVRDELDKTGLKDAPSPSSSRRSSPGPGRS